LITLEELLRLLLPLLGYVSIQLKKEVYAKKNDWCQRQGSKVGRGRKRMAKDDRSSE